MSFWTRYPVVILLLLIASKNLSGASLSINVPLDLTSRGVPGHGDIHQIQPLDDGGVAIGGITVTKLTKELLPNSAFTPPPNVRWPFAVLANGQIIVTRTNPEGPTSSNPFPCLVKLGPNGDIDPTFTAPMVWSGDNDGFQTIVSQPDGKIVVGCYNIVGSTRPSSAGPLFEGIQAMVFRLNPNGSFDGFTSKANIATKVIIPFASGTYIVGGSRGNYPNNKIARLLSDGSVDPTFTATVGIPSDSDDIAVNSIDIQQNGKILIAGNFLSVNLRSQRALARLNTDGTLDNTFTPPVVAFVNSMKLQADERIVIASQGLTRLKVSGEMDSSFRTPYFDEPIHAVSIDSSGQLYTAIPGTIFLYSGQFRVKVPPADVPTVFEKAAAISASWTPIQTIPANTEASIPDYSYPTNQTAFFRVRPAP